LTDSFSRRDAPYDIARKIEEQKLGKMVKIVWTDSAIEDLNAIGESLVELPEPKPKKKKKL